MEEMRKTSEKRLEALKLAHQAALDEVEEMRYNTVSMNYGSRELRDKDQATQAATNRLKRSREKFTSIEQLLHSVQAGVMHIGEIIGLHKTKGQQQSVPEILELLEQLLTELLDEDDENAGHTPVQTKGGSGGAGGGRKRSAGEGGGGKGEETAKFDSEMNMNLANVHIVPSVMNMNKESPGNSPQPSDDEDDEPSNLWGSDYSAQNIDAPPSRNAVKQISKSLSKEQRKVHAKRKSVVGGQLSTNN